MEKIKIILAFCSSVVILILVGVFLYTSTDQYRKNYNWVTHTQENISLAQSALSYMQDIETSSRGYAITGKENFLKPYYRAIENIDGVFFKLKYKTKDNLSQSNLVDALHHLAYLKKEFAKKTIVTRQKGDFEEAKRIISTGVGETIMSEARIRISEFITNEQQLLRTRIEDTKHSFASLLKVIAISVFISILSIVIALKFFIRDYDKRIDSERKVIESELKIKNFLEALPVGVYIVDSSGKPDYSNKKAIEILGHGISPELEKMNVDEIYVAYKAGTDTPYPIEEIPVLRALRGEKNIQVDDIEISKNNIRLPLRINASPIIDTNGKIKYAIAVLEDITEIKKNERALILANTELETIFRNASTGIILLDLKGKIVQWNPEAERIFGWTAQEVIGKIFQEVILRESFIRDQKESIHSFFKTQEDGISTGIKEMPAKRKDNTMIDIGLNITPTLINEENCYIIFVLDITENKRNVEALKTNTMQLIEAQRVGNIGSWEWDPINGKMYRSDEMYRIFGVSKENRAEEFYAQLVHPDDREYMDKIVENCYKDHMPFNFFFRIIRPDGEERVLNSKGKVVTNGKGEVTRLVGTSQDVTDAKRAEQELMKAKQIAEQSLVLKETFLANMSHEIRTPMNAIIGFTDILIKRNLQPQEKEYVQIIKNSGENLLRIINDILDISKIEADMIVFEEHPVSIKEIFKSLQTMMQQKATEKGLELIYKAEANVPDVLLGDPTRITQILLNLTGNSIKFTKTGKVEVAARALRDEKEKTVLQFAVSDTGIGIPEDKLNSIFERFKQAEDHTTRNYGGTGLGLSIAKQLVELQGGQMSITSKLNHGTQITFTLPLKKTKKVYQIKPVDEERKFDPEELKKLKILLAEDNPINVKLVLSLFSDYGIEADVAENGKEAVELVKGNYYDLVLMDMEMPEMNGYEATTVIREDLKNKVPIIAMTAHAMAGEREKCFKLGMYDYISKPINANLLFEKIYNATEFVKIWNRSAKKVINLEYLTNIMSGKKELIRETIEIFIKQANEDLPIINEAIAKDDYLTVKRFAHRMKSTITMMGINSLSPVLEEMEILGTEKNNMKRIKELNEKLNSTYFQALEEIKIEKLKYN
ncbi:MAG TPA: PAS domain S-box protein [Bacteroidia bacterium]|nr:PAS domain S-box protein [Bacteroidia bacterium]